MKITGMQVVIFFFCSIWQMNFISNPASIEAIDSPIVVQDSLILYNVITPNNDGLNDTLTFGCLDQFQSASILVVNQWGQRVFESSDYQDDWNGERNGQPLPAGQYKYYLNLDGRFFTSQLTIKYD